MSRQAIRARIALWCAAVNLDITKIVAAEAAVYALPDPAERRAIVREFNEVFA
ncbi:MAG TPA: hypothetical protein VL551_34980 [Actinospica sp.]|nr:hypothetical protein [Actinospica sp.]